MSHEQRAPDTAACSSACTVSVNGEAGGGGSAPRSREPEGAVVPAILLALPEASMDIDAAIAKQEERIAKLEAPTPPGSPTDAGDKESEPADDDNKKMLQAAVDFLREPQVQKAPMSAKINYLHQKNIATVAHFMYQEKVL